MKDIFSDLNCVIVSIGDMLIFLIDIQQDKTHLKKVYDKLCKHGIVLNKNKIDFSKTQIEYIGLILDQGKI